MRLCKAAAATVGDVNLPNRRLWLQLRMDGAMIATNSVAWQLRQQELDKPNVFDDTA